MNTPPLLLGAALLFWGWQTGMLWIAAPVAAALEAARLVRWRLDLDQDHFNRLWNLSTLLFIGTALYAFFAQGGYGAVTSLIEERQLSARTESLKQVTHFALTLVQWFPLNLFLFMLAFAFSRREELPVQTFSLYLRARHRHAAAGTTQLRDLPVKPAYPFLILVLIGAGASRANPAWYFPIMSVLIAWALWHRRSRRFRPWIWATASALALGLAFAGQIGLVKLQNQLEAWQNRLMARMGEVDGFDPNQSRTSIGERGSMKLSGRIVLRINPMGGAPPPLIREAAYNRLDGYHWSSSNRKFEPVLDDDRDNTWVLNPNAAPNRAFHLLGYTHNGERNLPLPNGAVLAADRTFSVVAIQTNALGTTRMVGAPSLASFELRYNRERSFELGPVGEDLSPGLMLEADLDAVHAVANQLGLAQLPPAEALKAVRSFFLNGFSYSLNPRTVHSTPSRRPTIADFLVQAKSGHCEYFATATTLLLRRAGIPARYATGYAVQEKRSDTEYLVRTRHAHAWTLAWLDGRWQEIDNTPGEWFEADAANARPWEGLMDGLSHAWLAFTLWRQGDSQMRLYVFVGGVLVLGFMAWRQVTGRKWRRSANERPTEDGTLRLGLDSEFYQIIRALQKQRPKAESESLTDWLNAWARSEPERSGHLRQLMAMHYRLRFDP
ncbi:MAG TPA: hypothetical protein DCY13_13685, partial [Verrucomicrobiales bacterium]|nr:hypothetical protein [Verrucomicrobiales bacterium]